jgi:hypothetical protein
MMSIDHYDPLQAPDPEAWLALGADARTELVNQYHEQAGVELPGRRVHAMMHVIVENQIAEGNAVLVATRLRQLMAQGLNRHQAIHAIASVVVQHIAAVMRSESPGDDGQRRFHAALKRLDARKWRRSE